MPRTLQQYQSLAQPRSAPFGDIATSSFYTLQEAFGSYGGAATPDKLKIFLLGQREVWADSPAIQIFDKYLI